MGLALWRNTVREEIHELKESVEKLREDIKRLLPQEQMVPIKFLHAMERQRPLCPDHRDKKVEQACLACAIEQKDRVINELEFSERGLQAKLKQAETDLKEILEKQLDFFTKTRVGKLLKKGKTFIVISVDESYFTFAYNLIRSQEMKQMTWSEEDEKEFHRACEEWALLRTAKEL